MQILEDTTVNDGTMNLEIITWVENMTRKTNTALIGLLGTILMGLATWTLVTLIELQLIVTMIQSDLMSIDKQFGRVYNFIDSVRGK
jgi:hypothetical protein